MKMNSLACFEIPLLPVAAVRPKVTRWNTYYPGAYGEYLPEAREWVSNHWQEEPIDGALFVRLVFVMPRPKSHYRSGKNSELVKDGAPQMPHQDIDNLVKGALDVMTGRVYEDDRQVHEVSAVKMYGNPGRTVVAIKRADPKADPLIT
jgi:Holliday junction resolvase RusA-like endonuclease